MSCYMYRLKTRILCARLNMKRSLYSLFQRLSRECTEEIRSLVKETAMNIELDPVLMRACKEEVIAFI